MGPPSEVPPTQNLRVAVPKPSKGKATKIPPTLEEVKVKTVPELITDYQLRQIRNHYGILDEVKTRIPLEGESVEDPSGRDVLIKAVLTKGVEKFPNTILLELLSLKHSSGECVMPHKVSYKAVTTCKDPLAWISKRKNTATQGTSLGTSVVAPAPKKSKKAPKESNPEVTPADFEVMPEVSSPISSNPLLPATILILDQVSSLDVVVSTRESSPVVPPPKNLFGIY
ncbi:hypothetical protein LIER_16079 [Lithospermum erythrorhizon]|uniref:Uncharacterized protein n=1 Tax=Lithospermum erythrorhizon TaxID=34254 RepID=A0AAV3Q9X3_LITER